MDGLEWKRAKWSKFAKTYLKTMERLAVFFSQKLIADAQGIAKHLDKSYQAGHKTIMIPYGAKLITESPDIKIIHRLGVEPHNYYLVVCRLEPENHVKEIIQGFITSNVPEALVIVGEDDDNNYIIELKKINNERVLFTGPIYNKDKLTALRYYCKAYIHGHSVGGTNPSLLESMACNNDIIAHDNEFNREVTNDTAIFFKDPETLREIIARHSTNSFFKQDHVIRVCNFYSWENITNQYVNSFNIA